jgi:hypothetical protein
VRLFKHAPSVGEKEQARRGTESVLRDSVTPLGEAMRRRAVRQRRRLEALILLVVLAAGDFGGAWLIGFGHPAFWMLTAASSLFGAGALVTFGLWRDGRLS